MKCFHYLLIAHSLLQVEFPATPINTPPNIRILLLPLRIIPPGQLHRVIQCDRQPPMPPTNHDHDHNHLAARIPPPTKAIRLIRKPNRQPNIRIPRHNLEQKAKHTIRLGVSHRVARLNQRDQKQRQPNRPDIMRQLAAQMLRDEVHMALLGHHHRSRSRARVEARFPGDDVHVWSWRDAHALEVVDALLDLRADEGGAAAADGRDAADGLGRGCVGDGGDGGHGPRGEQGGGDGGYGEGVLVGGVAGFRGEVRVGVVAGFVDSQGALFVYLRMESVCAFSEGPDVDCARNARSTGLEEMWKGRLWSLTLEFRIVMISG